MDSAQADINGRGGNTVSTVLYILGALAILGGIIGGIALAAASTESSMDVTATGEIVAVPGADNGPAAMLFATTGLVGGLILMAAGKALVLLQAQAMYLRKATEHIPG